MSSERRKFVWVRDIANDMIANLPCSKCKSKIGKRIYMISWIKEVGRPEYSVRLCRICGDKNANLPSI